MTTNNENKWTLGHDGDMLIYIPCWVELCLLFWLLHRALAARRVLFRLLLLQVSTSFNTLKSGMLIN